MPMNLANHRCRVLFLSLAALLPWSAAAAQEKGKSAAQCIAVNGALLMQTKAGGWDAIAAKSEVPANRPVKFQEVFATLYHGLGLDAHRDRVFDGSGTPRYPVESGIEPLHELI